MCALYEYACVAPSRPPLSCVRVLPANILPAGRTHTRCLLLEYLRSVDIRCRALSRQPLVRFGVCPDSDHGV